MSSSCFGPLPAGDFGPAWEPVGEAIPLLERTLAEREQILGDTHLDTRLCRNNLAIAYQAAGRVDEARSLRRRAGTNPDRLLIVQTAASSRRIGRSPPCHLDGVEGRLTP